MPSVHPSTCRTHELLAPAGNLPAFYAALAAGADAIYVGLGRFNARQKADNLSEDELAEACKKAHLAGARVYVALNVLLKDDELAEAFDVALRASALGADALIVQDWGLFFALHEYAPELELHVSTQCNIHDARAVTWCAEAGASRVTLSRELSLAEIHDIARACPTTELEVFSHGAICFSYSGLCQLSSFCCERRSANRGLCAQPCRLPYELLSADGSVVPTQGRERALCPRDNNTSELIPHLLKAGVASLKLEGRMKAADYVYSVVDVYRHMLDDALAGHALTPEEKKARARQLKRCFNRDFTSAYLQGRSDDEMMSYERSNNRGQEVGEVVESRVVGDGKTRCPEDRRNRVALVQLHLFEPIGTGDLIELRHDDNPDSFLAFSSKVDARAGETIEVKVPRSMPIGSRVRVLQSAVAHERAARAARPEYPRRREVCAHVLLRLGSVATLELACRDAPALAVKVTGARVEAARTRRLHADEVRTHIGRSGATPFVITAWDIELDEGVGMSFSQLHALRQDAVAALEKKILAPYCAKDRASRRYSSHYGLRDSLGCAAVERARKPCTPRATAGSDSASQQGQDAANYPLELCVFATSIEQAEYAQAQGVTRVYMSTDALGEAGLSPDIAAERALIPVLDEICHEKDHARLDPWIHAGAPVALGNISELALAREKGALPEIRSCIPVHNSASAAALARHGAASVWLSVELSLAEMQRFVPKITLPVGVLVMGRPRVMTSEHCILQVANACIHDCRSCSLRSSKMSLRNIDGKVLPVRVDVHGRSRLYDSTPLDLTPQLPQLIAAGVSRVAVDGTCMERREFEHALAHVVRACAALRSHHLPAPRLMGHGSGCLFAEVF